MTAVGKIRNNIQTLLQLRIGYIVVIICCTVANLVSNPQFSAVFYFAFYHNVDCLVAVGIDTGGVVHITVSIKAEEACYLALDTVRLVHLHTELLGIVSVPLIRDVPLFMSFVVAVRTVIIVYGIFIPCLSVTVYLLFIYLFHHCLQNCRKTCVIGIGFYCIKRLFCISIVKFCTGLVGKHCIQFFLICCHFIRWHDKRFNFVPNSLQVVLGIFNFYFSPLGRCR